ncbi:homoserine dehydrogenase [Bacillus canaveralius]|uniref:Homoserine dehydrogenase n=1 Tax=Bacillus canaveralius TaxID=1403243 RepID=A0A2N5GG15_9BACI|nr:homoserine dehydrogenase [Bacillus canaveralius]PLR79682.1 homoserine dehydrogenase [Bacillus canaveralius]PLR91982.1 homoserine dehydrogenase [Bacillus canaveralius]
MQTLNIVLLGYGTVGKGVYNTIHYHQERLKSILGKKVEIKAVLVKNIDKHKLPDADVVLTDRFEDIDQLGKIDVVIDAIVGKEPGFHYLKHSIKKGCHVITANKEMFAHHGRELLELANEQAVSVGYEATVGGGIPVIQTLRKLLNVNRIEKIEGILNGTSNFILTTMREEDLSFEHALSLAQRNGYAEADPTNDVEGYDAFYKAAILSQLVFGEQPDWNKTFRQGIAEITIEQIKSYNELGFRFKHVASMEKTASGVHCSVKPVLVTRAHPLYQVEGVQNAVSIDADIVGNISLLGPGAGMYPTASAIIEDLIHVGTDNPVPRTQAFDGLQEGHEKEAWVLSGQFDRGAFSKEIEVVATLDSENVIAKAAKKDIKLSGVIYYPLLGEYSAYKNSNEKELPLPV